MSTSEDRPGGWLPAVSAATFAQIGTSHSRAPASATSSRRWRDPLVGVVAGLAVFAAIWGFLSPPTTHPGVAAEHIRLAPAAHGRAVVTVILADFRGLDTLGEITVLAVAVVGVATLLRAGKLW